MPRAFRNPESLEAEKRTRAALVPFFEQRGFSIDDPIQSGARKNGQPHLIRCREANGHQLVLWVKLCWRKGDGRFEAKYSAAQIMAHVDRRNWVGSIQAKVNRIARKGATHLLLVQNTGPEIGSAVLVPIGAVTSIWEQQRLESARLIASGSRQGKNHAENGVSPTIWVQDDDAPSVPRILWDHPHVVDMAKFAASSDVPAQDASEDSLSDLDLRYAELGSDGAKRTILETSGVRRDPRVRSAVLQRSGQRCERCGIERNFPGFYDVHHILGAEKGDRVWNCVTLCPNCHREAHFDPDRNQINARLLAFASSFKP